MTITLRVRPTDPVIGWEQFCKEMPPFSIALDGYVSTGPRFDERGPRANFNHHEEVDRLATRSTCAQVLMAIRSGLFESFSQAGAPHAFLMVNDCDEDVCMSAFLFNHADLVIEAINPRINRLVGVTDFMDTTAGAYPFPADLSALEELSWMFEPYRRFRVSGGLDRRRTAADFERIIAKVDERIVSHLHDRGRRKKLDVRYETLERGDAWSLVRETGADAKVGIAADGIHAYISVRPWRDDPKRWSYTVARRSHFIRFDVIRILKRLSEIEGVPWGGGNTIGGSPRASGSELSPSEVFKIAQDVLRSR